MMRLLLDLKERARRREMMDEPDLDPARHRHALIGLQRLNKWSGSARLLWQPIAELARSTGKQGQISVMDVATGAGDNLIEIARLARRVLGGIDLELAGCDISARAAEYAQANAASAGVDIRVFSLDVLSADLPQEYDVVMCSLFLHHLTTDEAVVLLQRMKAAARRLVVIVDLRRHRAGYILALAASRLLTRSEVVHVDALRSVRAAFTIPEVDSLMKRAGLDGATVKPCRPFRFTAVWKARS